MAHGGRCRYWLRAVSRVGVHRRGVCLPPVCVASCCLTSAVATAHVGCLGHTPWPIGAAGWCVGGNGYVMLYVMVAAATAADRRRPPPPPLSPPPLSPLPLVGLRTADLAVRPSTYRNPALGRQRGQPRWGTPALWPRGRGRCHSPPSPFLAGDDGAVAHCDNSRRGLCPFIHLSRPTAAVQPCLHGGGHGPQM